MHASSLENMHKCYREYIADREIETRKVLKVMDIGGANVNGSYSDIFCQDNVEYIGTDLYEGPGVSLVLDDPNVLPVEDNSIDVVVSGQMLEHCEFFWVAFAEMVRVVKEDGYIFLIAPSAGPIHNYPVDCYRFYPDAYRALAKYAGCHLLDVWMDNRGPWNDLVGVFNKTGKMPEQVLRTDAAIKLADVQKANHHGLTALTEFDVVKGEVPYMEVLTFLHRALTPRNYLEIGVRKGKSLALAKCNAVGVDPMPDLDRELKESTRLIVQKSDDFFADNTDPILTTKPDFVFIDGMHLFEYALRDFMNVEKLSGPDTVVIIDDVYPSNPQQATRDRKTIYWMGDVWVFQKILEKFRPDLVQIPLDTDPSGLLMICGLDANNTVLWESYNPIITWANSWKEPGKDVTERHGILSPNSQKFKHAMQIIKVARENDVPLSQKTIQIRAALK